MPSKLVVVLSLVFLAIIPAYAASPEPNSVPIGQHSLQILIEKANKGDVNAQFNLGEIYFKGEGVPQDYNEALKWYKEAAEAGDANSQFSLGGMYGKAQGIVQDNNEALKWYRKAAKQGHPSAQYWLGWMYIVTSQDYQEAHKWFRKSAERDFVDAQFTLGNICEDNQDYNEAKKWYTKAAEQGYAPAQINLGIMYDKGEGILQDSNEALKWYKKAAGQGDAGAQYLVGLTYDLGWGIPQNGKEAVKWYSKAAEQGNADAQRCLGLCYGGGQGVEEDGKKALYWFRKAADHGDVIAQNLLGRAYYFGYGQDIEPDYNQAVYWFCKAVEKGNAEAQYYLGVCYLEGRGVNQDYKKAVNWLRKASEKGEIGAQWRLGDCYADGKGVIEDYIEAYKWYLLAGMNGANVSDKKKYIQNKMSPAGIEESQKRAKEFVDQQMKSNRSERDNPKSAIITSLKGTGTAFCINSDGFFLTAFHVVQGAKGIKIKTGKGLVSATSVISDEGLDIAILKVETKDLTALPLVSSSQTSVGDKVFTVGFPNVLIQGTEPKYTDGTISSLSGIGDNIRHFQISIPVQPGNSGGPLLSAKGEVIGVIVSRLDDIGMLEATGTLPQNVNYAVKSAFIIPLLENLPEWQSPKTNPHDETMSNSDIINKAKNAIALVLVY